ncbi:hypothetical protein [Chelativorans sp.]|uniref:hypothetical protein n=1 Tax=Chelativorans sp. TaxID=2203393 RepID=UPI0028123334|nr:hypothetical protein [Chelativorans sp.]
MPDINWKEIDRETARAEANAEGGEAVAEFGQGNWAVDIGTMHGKPAVFVAPAKMPGVVGTTAARENNPHDRLVAGEWFMTFPTMAQAQLVADALCNQAHPAPQPSGPVKALEWNPFRAETPWGYYHIDDQRDRPAEELKGRLPFLLSGSHTDLSRYQTLEAAKAAAQADYERRVLSALASSKPDAPHMAVPSGPETVLRGEDWENAAHELFWKTGKEHLFELLRAQAHDEAEERLAKSAAPAAPTAGGEDA